MKNISLQTIKRIPTYYNVICNILSNKQKFLSSNFLSDLMGIDDTTVRKDLSSIGCNGRPKQGYNIIELKKHFEIFLGFNQPKNAIIIGAGNLGCALAKYEKFKKYGLNLIALFDKDPHKIDLVINGIKVYNLSKIQEICKDNNVEIAILTLPEDEAQSITNTIIKYNINTIWNFSPVNLSVPTSIFVWNQDLVSNFLTLSKLAEIKKHKI